MGFDNENFWIQCWWQMAWDGSDFAQGVHILSMLMHLFCSSKLYWVIVLNGDNGKIYYEISMKYIMSFS